MVSGHVDGSIWVFSFDDGAGARLCTHTCVPYALSWGASIVAAGADKKVAFYNEHNTSAPQVFDYAADDSVRLTPPRLGAPPPYPFAAPCAAHSS